MPEMGDKIKQARFKLKKTQKEVSEILDLKQGAISKIESGKVSSGKSLIKYLKYLKKKGIDMNELI